MFSVSAGLLKQATVFILVNDEETAVSVDTRSLELFISYDYDKRHKLIASLEMYPWHLHHKRIPYCQDQPIR